MRVLIALMLQVLLGPGAEAWQDHQLLASRLLSTPEAAGKSYLQLKIPAPCIEEEVQEREALARRVGIRAEAIPVFSKTSCAAKKRSSFSAGQILAGGFIDEPDLGMDQDLPGSADPNGIRRWMGGERGPTSQGFRHMFFPGIEWLSPLSTFQLPVTRVGEAFSRAEVFSAELSRALARGDVFWSLRLALWREHLLQDLHQPFHTTQLPSLRMVPWSKLFSGIVGRTTHAVSNYHYAYEGLVAEWVRISGPEFDPCFVSAQGRPFLGEAGFSRTPRRVASVLGAALYVLLGDSMKSEEVDLPAGKGEPDYYLLLNARRSELSPEERASVSRKERKAYDQAFERVSAMEEIKSLTCGLMKEVAASFWGNIDALFQDPRISTSSTTGR